MPKVIVAACGDEFFRPDDSYTFFGGLPEPKYMLQVFFFFYIIQFINVLCYYNCAYLN